MQVASLPIWRSSRPERNLRQLALRQSMSELPALSSSTQLRFSLENLQHRSVSLLFLSPCLPRRSPWVCPRNCSNGGLTSLPPSASWPLLTRRLESRSQPIIRSSTWQPWEALRVALRQRCSPAPAFCGRLARPRFSPSSTSEDVGLPRTRPSLRTIKPSLTIAKLC